MAKTKCSKCGYEWTYKGNSKIFATCPQCLNKIKVKGSEKLNPAGSDQSPDGSFKARTLSNSK